MKNDYPPGRNIVIIEINSMTLNKLISSHTATMRDQQCSTFYLNVLINVLRLIVQFIGFGDHHHGNRFFFPHY